jgi:hypothetical protein
MHADIYFSLHLGKKNFNSNVARKRNGRGGVAIFRTIRVQVAQDVSIFKKDERVESRKRKERTYFGSNETQNIFALE